MFDTELTARKFTDCARRAVDHIYERACDRGMFDGEFNEATAGMLAILSVVRWERKLGRVALEQIGIDLDAFARELEDAIAEESLQARRPGSPEYITLPSGQTAVAMTVDLNTPILPLLDQAEREAREMGHNYVGSEHLVLASIQSACLRLQEILSRHAITIDGVRQAIRELLQQR